MNKRQLRTSQDSRYGGAISARFFGADVAQNVAASPAVTILTTSLVRILNIRGTMANMILLIVAALAVAFIILAGSRGVRIGSSGFWVNVLANVCANSILLFIHPVNSWVKALPYAGAVAVALAGFPLALIVLYRGFQISGEDRETSGANPKVRRLLRRAWSRQVA